VGSSTGCEQSEGEQHGGGLERRQDFGSASNVAEIVASEKGTVNAKKSKSRGTASEGGNHCYIKA